MSVRARVPEAHAQQPQGHHHARHAHALDRREPLAERARGQRCHQSESAGHEGLDERQRSTGERRDVDRPAGHPDDAPEEPEPRAEQPGEGGQWAPRIDRGRLRRAHVLQHVAGVEGRRGDNREDETERQRAHSDVSL